MVGGAPNLSIVGAGGTALTSTPVASRQHTFNVAMPWISATASRVYYLDGGTDLRYLPLNSRSIEVRPLPLTPSSQQAGIAVSPDNSRIAVAILTYNVPVQPSGPGVGPGPVYTGMRMYVEDTADGAHHVDIFSSSTVAEYPIGWVGGNLVVALTDAPMCCQAVGVNPYSATEYHVVNPNNGVRIATICHGTFGPMGPPERSSVVCIQGQGAAAAYRWDGTAVAAPAGIASSDVEYLGALSPDGSTVALGEPSGIRIVSATLDKYVVQGTDYVFGWLDSERVVYFAVGAPGLSVVDILTGSSTQIPQSQFYDGAFPTELY